MTGASIKPGGTQHRKEIIFQGQTIASYSINHKKGARDEVKICYVLAFRKAIKEF